MEMKYLTLLLILFSFSAYTASPLVALASSPSDGQSPSSSEDQPPQKVSKIPSNVNPKLKKICQEVNHPTECVTTTVPFLGENADISPVTVLQAEIEAIDSKAKEALAKATKLAVDPATSKTVTVPLNICIDGYKAILKNKQAILDAISKRDADELNMELSSNVDHISQCEDAFEEAKINSPIPELHSLLGKMIFNSINIGVDMVEFENKN
ncbi:Pectinesterase inhibitor [Gossypium australe]|uniref:Pectinesterase inhibitor n=1 Tax=Gossypium australe TaxID=47621 RepID=A0A5B6U968_9ROSI|nr:Pectinesterase inhibitor [Gossypium australe]